MNDLNISIKNSVGTVCINRPEIHNAFNDELIKSMTEAFNQLDNDNNVQIIVLTGEGRSFCAGADLNWMSSMIDYTLDENIEDSKKLANLFETINNVSKPVIGKINGAALGGGVGLVAVCDYAITHEKSKFGFTETRLGLIPAVISPYCIRKIGESNARAWFLSGDRFSAQKAREMNLIHQVSTLENFEDDFNKLIESYLVAGPKATIEAKKLIKIITDNNDYSDYTTTAISQLRVSQEGQEGMKALLEKRKPNWVEL